MKNRPTQRLANLCATAAAFVTLAHSTTVWAHPGHGVTEANRIEHYVAEPAHATPWLLTVAVVAALATLAYVRSWRIRTSGK